MAGVLNYKTPYVFHMEDDLSMLIEEAESMMTKEQMPYIVNRMKMFASSAYVPHVETSSSETTR